MRIRDATHHVGSKIALICDDRLVTYLRDDFQHIPDPGLWDLPGGERDTDETALACAIRETIEEFGIRISPASVIYESDYPSHQPDRADVAFFVAHIDQQTVDSIVFGDEGQCWRMMEMGDFLSRNDAVKELQQILAQFRCAGQARTP